MRGRDSAAPTDAVARMPRRRIRAHCHNRATTGVLNLRFLIVTDPAHAPSRITFHLDRSHGWRRQSRDTRGRCCGPGDELAGRSPCAQGATEPARRSFGARTAQARQLSLPADGSGTCRTCRPAVRSCRRRAPGKGRLSRRVATGSAWYETTARFNFTRRATTIGNIATCAACSRLALARSRTRACVS